MLPSLPAADRRLIQIPDVFVAADSARILEDLQTLSHDSMEGRQTGTRGSVMAQGYISTGLRSSRCGCSPGRAWCRPSSSRGRRDTTQVTRGANVVGFIPGTEPELGAIVLTAHYDHLGVRTPRPGTPAEAEGDSIYNGADDNASGTVGVMSMARYFAKFPPRHTMVFAAVDAEEMGIRGSGPSWRVGGPRTSS